MHRLLPPCLLLLLNLGAGCTRPTEITVVQSHLATAEQRMVLTTDAAWFAGDGKTAALLLQLPLPGATRGRNFCLYLRMADREGEQTIAAPLPGGGFVGGYFVQLRGRRRGLTEIVSGRVALETRDGKGVSGTLALTCGDGSKINGRFAARHDARTVRAYEQGSGDAQNLLRGQAPTSGRAFAFPSGDGAGLSGISKGS